MTIDEISDNFSLLDEWEDRYRYIIELGRTLAPLPAAAYVDANKVQGCASQVWLTTTVQSNGPQLRDPARVIAVALDGHRLESIAHVPRLQELNCKACRPHRRMPELEWEFGYFVVVGLIATTCVSLFLWFRRVGWL